MKIIRSIQTMRRQTAQWKKKSLGVGFVPTMGYIHDGHLSLMRRARRSADRVVASIFVNPSQFGPGEDIEHYPRDFARDEKLLKATGVDAIFYPDVRTMYPDGFSTHVRVDGISSMYCGASRPFHFQGVATVVCKLLNIVSPDQAVFGQKDAQQLYIIRRMIRDLDMQVKIISAPIVREKDGLAMSSRNAYLSPEERVEALCLVEALRRAADMARGGERSAGKVRRAMRVVIRRRAPGAQVDYIAVVDPATFTEIKTITGKCRVLLAVRIGKTRLIDNMSISPRRAYQ